MDAQLALAEGMVERIETLEDTLRRVASGKALSAARPKHPEREKRKAALAGYERMALNRLALSEDDAIIGLRGVATVFNQVAMLNEPTCFLPGAFGSGAGPRLLRGHDGKRTLAPAGRATVREEGNVLAFRFTSLPDAFGSLVLEAMAAGLTQCSVGTRFRSGLHKYVGNQSVLMVTGSGLPEISLVEQGAFPPRPPTPQAPGRTRSACRSLPATWSR